MIDAIKLRILQGDPIIHDVRNVSLPKLFRGLPTIERVACPDDCKKCVEACPTNAIKLNPVSIDLGLCVFCPLCEEACPEKIIHFTNDYHIAAESREKLIVTKETKTISAEKASKEIKNYFGRSLKLRQISAGGCNGCELELNALSNVNFDMGRYGIEFVASPRHADGVVITGPLTRNMTKAIEICYEAVPKPKIIVLVGTCSISGGIFQNSKEIQRNFLEENKIDLFIPGCPPHPLTFINGLLDWLDRK
ncbi:MAG: NADH:ubiquinone oxidoreductase [Ignavibacteria bacterium CG22_combo_CG10-13_8_21_14_all_37_15]|nr:NADH:ubiquinone oxidoreductase [Ignavibacteria bacterium]OIO18362.1 MAG: NADH:ubiquinone oxidoreductase [Ignavibacteria bacterium CG1_02_37_35]PIP79453.1 MAG: NADH:ubiquinone oxidoreductase [Ignavibacteria bacterium CG22_combo_CG10-13_8_21_14_all_37_15]PIS43903.1 MAG: NADH:ubiquinone oxidoreductase [Ignavibacteria bacterium CG08_land_8_20_14_0_20_37_9]PIX94989.1 MAG: NADH:ubiquinone oxidoreductase [Ignavibacteria bacterium CG_4_10_14_3_um_filter_37_18]PJC61070.1 MAG: NADH:ubiquinone oxidore